MDLEYGARKVPAAVETRALMGENPTEDASLVKPNHNGYERRFKRADFLESIRHLVGATGP